MCERESIENPGLAALGGRANRATSRYICLAVLRFGAHEVCLQEMSYYSDVLSV